MRLLFFLTLLFCSRLHADPENNYIWVCTDYSYDSLGRLAKVVYPEDKTIVRQITFAYEKAHVHPTRIDWFDENHLLLKTKFLYYDAADSLIKTVVIHLAEFSSAKPGTLPDLSSSGAATKLYAYPKQIPDTVFYYCERNAGGLRVKDSTCFSANKDKWINGYIYENGKLVSETFSISPGNAFRETYTYDNDGRLGETNFFGEHGETVRQTTYSYLPNGKLQFETQHDDPGNPSGPPEVREYCYDKNGRVEKIRIRLNRSWRNKVTLETFTWSADGKLAGHCFYTTVYDELD